MSRVKPTGRLGDLAKIRAENREPVIKVLPLIKEVALRESGPDPDRDPLVIHPSEMAKADWCTRATYWRISGKPEPDRKFNFVLENIFEEGNTIHDKWQRWLRGTGKLFGLWECLSCGEAWTGVSGALTDGWYDAITSHKHAWAYREVRLRTDGSLIVGRADGAIEDTLVECKSVGIGTLRVEANDRLKKYYNADAGLYDLDKLWKELRRPFPSHIRQANVYLWLAKEMGLPYTRMTFIYEFKPNQQSREYSITLSEDVINPLLEKARVVENALNIGQPPPCEFGGCEQCRAYENSGEPSENSKESSGEPDVKARRVVTRSPSRAGKAGTGEPSRSSGRQATRVARGADRSARPRADGSHEQIESVGRPPGLPVERGSGRRTVRRVARGEADRSSANS